jgi:hypothetical protein
MRQSRVRKPLPWDVHCGGVVALMGLLVLVAGCSSKGVGDRGRGTAPVDAAEITCGAAGEPCCAGACAGSHCCVSGMCLANGDTCPSGGTCSNGACSSSASLLASTDSLVLGSAASGQPTPAAGFTLTNTGQQPSGPITLVSSSTDFTIQAGLAGDCVSGVSTLLTNASCAVHVIFTPVTAGASSALITYSASPGGSGNVRASGTGVSPNCRLEGGGATTRLDMCTLVE